MKSLVEVILDCDRSARKIISDAELEKQKIEKSTADEIKALRDAAYRDADARLDNLLSNEKNKSREKAEALKADYSKKLREFDDLFNADCEKWSDDIIGSILRQ
jgi:hypothetical protein